MKLKITFLIMCALFLGTVTGFGQVIVGSGTLEGSTLTWILTSDSTLTIRGTGDMPDDKKPWFDNSLYLNVTKVVIGDGVTRIGSDVFSNCRNLTSVNLSTSVKSIGYSAFRGCSKLFSIDLKEVEIIESEAFAYCRALTSVTIPATVTSIESGAFSNCFNLSTINADGNASYVVEDDVLYNTAKTLLLFYPNAKTLSTFTIPSTVDTIGAGAFTENPNLTSVDIPASVTYIGDYAFNNCSALASVTLAEGLESIGNSAFSGCSNLTAVDIPASVRYIGHYAFDRCNALASVTLSEGLRLIGPGAFRYCNFASITLPESLVGIYNETFAYNTSLTSISIPVGVNDIGPGLFSGCTSLQSINVAAGNLTCSSYDGVLYNTSRTHLLMYPVGKRAASFAVPDGVTIIGSGAFTGDTTLTAVTLPASVEEIGDFVFRSCTNLASIDLTNVKILGKSVFSNSGLTSIVIPGELTSLPDGAFADCLKLDSVTIREGVTSIGNSAFSFSLYLKSVIIPNSVKTIGEGAFHGCPLITSINIPDSLKRIEEHTFHGCAGLTTIDIPGSVEYIGNYAFASCYGLTDVIVHWQNAIHPAASSFFFHEEDILHIPAGTRASYEADPVWSQFTIEEIESLVVEENEPAVTGNEGSIALSLSIPANSTIIGTFNIILPYGMKIDTAGTQLVGELAELYTRTITKIDGMNAWKFEISVNPTLTRSAAQAARLRTVSEITTIMNIGFTVDPDVDDDDYEIELTDFNVQLQDLGTLVVTDFLDIDANTVLKVEVPVTRTTVALVEITPGSLTGEVGGSAQLTVAVTAGETVDKTVTWRSLNEAVAKVIPAGATTATVTYIGAGTAKIIATANDGSLKADTIIVTVTEPTVPVDPDPIVVLVSSITIDKASLTGVAGGTAKLSATVSPVNATDASVTWSSSNNAVATVDASGLVTYVANGTATITATANDGSGVSSSITVTVTPQMSIEDAKAVALTIRPLSGALQISGLIPGEDLRVYNISGQLIYKGKATAADQYIQLNARGALIVVAGKRTVKTILN